ncbi:MAG: FHIPEP family type III secretion protein [Candidatus Eremiobacteraeota bacterium]|nr:FHIPEP family type III secretion protein [Candidatus Eremiobacteraeota bacterium]
MPPSDANHPLQRLLEFSEVMMAVVVLGIVFMLIVPLPPGVLDFFLVCNITFSVITILIALSITEPLEFSVFPTMLLVTTLFRLSLDVSATRMILLNGYYKDPLTHMPTGAGHLIPAFGKVVVGGNLLVGLILFVILITIQMLVITKGAERVAQVAARFTLDKMPGEQMAIDSDLAAGIINSDQARERRAKVQRHADFYGSMDGAGKFITGDAMAAVIIMVVNIVGGMAMGVVYFHMSLWDALNTFALLSIGNGLITTVPAFLMSTSMGLIVTRAASQSNLARDLILQITAQPRALKMATQALFGMGVFGLTGLFAFPSTPFLVLSCLLHFCLKSLESERNAAIQISEVKEEQVKGVKRREPVEVTTIMEVDPVAMEVGRGLLGLVNPDEEAKLISRVVAIRRHLALELGIVVPGVRFRDNLQLAPNSYVIKMRNLEVARGEVFPTQFLAIGPEEKLKNLRGTRTTDPTYGMPGVWISPEQRGDAERLGCMLFDPVSVMATQMTEVLRARAAELLGRQEVQALLDLIKRAKPMVVKEATQDLSVGDIQKVLCNLLSERVSIRDLSRILECLADHVGVTKDPDLLTEFVRVRLAPNICEEYVNNDKLLNVISLDPEMERSLRQAMHRDALGLQLNLDPREGQAMLSCLAREIEGLRERGLQPIVLTAPDVRPALRRLCERTFPTLVVLSWNEIAPGIQVNSLTMACL